MAKNSSPNQKRKRKWPIYVGILSSVGAIAMMSSQNTTGAFFYAIVAICCFGYALQRKRNKTFCACDSDTVKSYAEDITSETPLAAQEIIPTAPTENPVDRPEIQAQTQVAEDDVPDDIIDKTYRVTGIQHYLGNLLELAVPNSNYDMTKKEIIDFGMTDQNIWEYEFYPSKLELQPEPDNPQDPNAIKVLIDDKHVGYIKSGSCKHLLNVIEQDRFIGATCKIGGGKYKRVDEEYDYDKDKSTHTLDKGEKNFSIVLTIKEKRN